MNLNNESHFILVEVGEKKSIGLIIFYFLFLPNSQNNPYSLHSRNKDTMYPL